jgi:hypothetical protein
MTAPIEYSMIIDVEARDVIAKLTRLSAALSPPMLEQFLLGSVVPYIQERIKRRFATQGDDAVEKWDPLQPSTQEERIAEGYSPDDINYRTGELFDYIANADGDVSTGAISANLTYPKLDTEEAVLYQFVAAQAGVPSQGVPARPVLALSEADLWWTIGSLEAFIRTAAGV